ncbi:polysaccharide deacetylase family protein [Paenibacillus taiwanensis]|uniref:polysaccharide deacetylase family protein n=1 Tax=Paenibacillus taiwanensis TaxID=401638 RepID=UPI000412500F|nr:polysaccharide deacetylase family protein [Paenibacillus taiwanensis]
MFVLDSRSPEARIVKEIPLSDEGCRYVCLTLDDGPDPQYTPIILDILKEYGAKVTFFSLGRNAVNYPELVQRAYEEGHEIANHTYSHPELPTITIEQVQAEIRQTEELLSSITGQHTALFRPPYGKYNDEVLNAVEEMGYTVILWSDPLEMMDWELPGSDVLVKTALDHVENGSIMLLHDAGGERGQTVEAIRQLLPLLMARGYQFVTVSDLLERAKVQRKESANVKALIPRYDESFLNCTEGHVISYFANERIPVEWLFYSTWEPSARIFEHFIQKRDNRWHYPSTCGARLQHDLPLLGVSMHMYPYQSFEAAADDLRKWVGQGRVVFLFINGYYFEHRVYSYKKLHETHNVMITGVSDTVEGTFWFIQDHAQPDFYDYYAHAIVQVGFDDNQWSKHPKGLMISDINRELANAPNRHTFLERYRKWLDAYEDDFSFYDYIQEYVVKIGRNGQGTEQLAGHVYDAFHFIASARRLFVRFLLVAQIYEAKQVADVHRIIGLLEGNLADLDAYRSGGSFPLNEIIGRCRELKWLEQDVLHNLKRQYQLQS